MDDAEHEDHGHVKNATEKVSCLAMSNYWEKIIITIFFFAHAAIAIYIPGINVIFEYFGVTSLNAV